MRRNKSIFVLALLLGLINGIGYANAQTTTPSDQTLIYGTSVKGEITSSVASDNYTFVGKANDVVVISMKQDGLDSNLSPLIKVRNYFDKVTFNDQDAFCGESVENGYDYRGVERPK